MAKKKYTVLEQMGFYAKRFLKVAVPLTLVMLPLVYKAWIDWSTVGVLVIVPVLSTFDKFARDNGWYSY